MNTKYALAGAHPRSRGENTPAARLPATSTGSSPLTRGKLQRQGQTHPVVGLIPAHAGKTSIGCVPLTIPWAHPRSRGENVLRLPVGLHPAGSSPLTRGKPKTGATLDGIGGLIPAHAGKTDSGKRSWIISRAHPRSRGENRNDSVRALGVAGSSPLTRGKHFLTCAFIAQIGQILESRELCASSESYSLRNVYATAAPQDQVRSIGLAPLSSRGAS